jgi:hypothetical protein
LADPALHAVSFNAIDVAWQPDEVGSWTDPAASPFVALKERSLALCSMFRSRRLPGREAAPASTPPVDVDGFTSKAQQIARLLGSGGRSVSVEPATNGRLCSPLLAIAGGKIRIRGTKGRRGWANFVASQNSPSYLGTRKRVACVAGSTSR